VRRVAHAEVVLQIVHGPRFDVGRPSHHGPVIRMRGESGGVKLLEQDSEVAVVDGSAALGVNNATFGFNDLGIESKIANAVGFHVHHEFQGGAGEPVLIDGVVGGGVGVV